MDIKMLIFCRTLSIFKVKVDLWTLIIETTSSNENNPVLRQTLLLKFLIFNSKSIHQIAQFFFPKNKKFSRFWGAHPPPVCARAQLVLKRHEIISSCPRRIFAPVHSILLVCLDYLPLPNMYNLGIHHCIMPMCVR